MECVYSKSFSPKTYRRLLPQIHVVAWHRKDKSILCISVKFQGFSFPTMTRKTYFPDPDDSAIAFNMPPDTSIGNMKSDVDISESLTFLFLFALMSGTKII